ncbi:glycerol-3-phosphate dehydrogenase/oxidase [Thalassorhabdus alkalitolerans]|uniref:Glycerol-3-phosphate dehydrogenase n=1 Tax=Thalassorhabdus alkalitolerans TaxID=2282697 RepID=A0ABW0YMJ4_9BACI
MKQSRFSAISRTERLEEMSGRELDLLVIGGGITGAGIALDTAARGIDVGLIEMQDFAEGTSSRSTKLVHGGLRYLKQFEVKLVAEVGKERAIVYENAPHVTTPEWMLLPIIENGTFGKFSTSLGLKVYDTLARVKKSEKRYMLNKEETLKKEPLLLKDKVKGGGVYVEYRTDDARLTLETIKKANDLGANPVNHAKAESFIYNGNKAVGVNVKDLVNDKTYEIYAKHIVSAAGPWVDELREKDGSKKGKQLHLTKGVHLVFDRERFPLQQAVYFDTPDGRMVFAIPRDKKAYVGTTDTVYKGDIASPRMTEEDRDYLLQAANEMFPEVNLSAEDVESSWAGLRPLIYEEGKNASEISRKDEVFISESGLISIAGGKLTGYRKMAERIADIVTEKLNIHAPCPTEHIKLSGGDVGGSAGFDRFIEENQAKGLSLGFSEEEAREIVRFYGSNAPRLFELVKEQGEIAKEYGLPLHIAGKLLYALQDEMAVTPLDFFNRRTAYLYFGMEQVMAYKKNVAAFMKDHLRWTEEQERRFTRVLEEEIKWAQVPLGKESGPEAKKVV